MIVWRDQMRIGNELIDGDHRYLMCLINTVELALRSESYRDVLDTVLEQLDQYTREHFAREEKLQIQYRYVRHDEHALRHRQLIRELGEIRAKVNALEDSKAAAEAATEIAKLLKHWLIDHVLHDDMLMKPLFG